MIGFGMGVLVGCIIMGIGSAKAYKKGYKDGAKKVQVSEYLRGINDGKDIMINQYKEFIS